MSGEYDLAQDKVTILKLIYELRRALGESPAYSGTQDTSDGYQGGASAGSNAPGSAYQGTGVSTGPSGGPDPERVNAIIGGLEMYVERLGRCLEDRLDNIDGFQRDGRLHSEKPSRKYRTGDKAAGEEAEDCRKFLSAIAFWIREGRAALSRISSSSPSRTPRNGLAGLVQSAMSSRRGNPPTYAVRRLLDETVYRLGNYPTATQVLAPDPEPIPYLGQRSNDRDAGIAEKVSLGNALKPRSLPTMYLPIKTYEIPEYPPKPLERAYYDRYKPPLNY